MIECVCMNISISDIISQMENTGLTFEEAKKQLLCGSGCGACSNGSKNDSVKESEGQTLTTTSSQEDTGNI